MKREELIERLSALHGVFELRSRDEKAYRMGVRQQYANWAELIQAALDELERNA